MWLTSSIAVTEGDGSIAYFKKFGSSFSSPAGDFTTLEKSGTRYDRTYPDGTVVKFTATGLQDSVVDRFGSATRFTYSSGKLTKITDPAGKEITFSYGTYGISQIRPDGVPYRYVDLNVDSNKHLTWIEDPDNIKALQIAYDTAARADSVVDRRGGVTHFVYDGLGYAHSDSLPEIEANGTDQRPVIEYMPPARLVGPTPGSGEGTSGSPATPLVADSVRAWVEDPEGNRVYFTIDRFGAPTRIEEPKGRVTMFTRNSNAQITRIVSPAADTVDLTWVGSNLTTMQSSTTGQVINYSYDSTYNQVTHVWGDAPESWFHYTSGGLDSARVATGADTVTTKYELDTFGRVEKITDPEGHVTEVFFSTSGLRNTDSVEVGSTRAARYIRDSYGRGTATVNAQGDTSRVVYDEIGRVTASVNAANDTTSFAYDSLLLRTVTDAIDQEYEVERNALGWVSVQIDPRLEKDSLSYDLNGHLKRLKTRAGDVITFAYDSLGMLTQRVAGGDTTYYANAADGTWRSAQNNASTDTLFYDDAGRLTKQKSCRGGTCYVLESFMGEEGVRDSLKLTSPWTRSVKYGYDAALRLQQLVDVAGDTTVIGRDSDGMVTYIEMPTGDSITFEITDHHGSAEILHTDSSIDTALGQKVYRDSLGRIIELVRLGLTEDTIRYFEYDEIGQLEAYSDTTGSVVYCTEPTQFGIYCVTLGDTVFVRSGSYDYDEVGNPDGTGITVATGNRLTAFDNYTLVYDDAGRLTRKYKTGFDHRYYWNAVGQLDSVTTGSLTVRYTYDGFGRRIEKSSTQGTEKYIWDGDDVLLELDASDSLAAEYVHYPGVDRPHSMRRGGDVYYYGVGATGSVLGLFDDSTAVNRYRYDPFGLAQDSTVESVSNPLRFKGRRWDDEVGLYYVRSRYYDPHTRRFISEDPIGLAGGINPFVFLSNDPVNRRDPFGLQERFYELEPITVEVDPIIHEYPCLTGFVDEYGVCNLPDPGAGGWYDGGGGSGGGGGGSVTGGRMGQGNNQRITEQERPSCSVDVRAVSVALLRDVAGYFGYSAMSAVRLAREGQYYTRIGGQVWGEAARGTVGQTYQNARMFVSHGRALTNQSVGRGLGAVGLQIAGMLQIPDRQRPWEDLKRIPVLGTGLLLGEVIHSCGSQLFGE